MHELMAASFGQPCRGVYRQSAKSMIPQKTCNKDFKIGRDIERG